MVHVTVCLYHSAQLTASLLTPCHVLSRLVWSAFRYAPNVTQVTGYDISRAIVHDPIKVSSGFRNTLLRS
jgi:hypothetical protein